VVVVAGGGGGREAGKGGGVGGVGGSGVGGEGAAAAAAAEGAHLKLACQVAVASGLGWSVCLSVYLSIYTYIPEAGVPSRCRSARIGGRPLSLSRHQLLLGLEGGWGRQRGWGLEWKEGWDTALEVGG